MEKMYYSIRREATRIGTMSVPLPGWEGEKVEKIHLKLWIDSDPIISVEAIGAQDDEGTLDSIITEDGTFRFLRDELLEKAEAEGISRDQINSDKLIGINLWMNVNGNRGEKWIVEHHFNRFEGIDFIPVNGCTLDMDENEMFAVHCNVECLYGSKEEALAAMPKISSVGIILMNGERWTDVSEYCVRKVRGLAFSPDKECTAAEVSDIISASVMPEHFQVYTGQDASDMLYPY